MHDPLRGYNFRLQAPNRTLYVVNIAYFVQVQHTFGTVSFYLMLIFHTCLVSHIPDKKLKRQKRNIPKIGQEEFQNIPKIGPDEFQNLHFPPMPPGQKLLVFRGQYIRCLIVPKLILKECTQEYQWEWEYEYE